jgi:hypothetical protein
MSTDYAEKERDFVASLAEDTGRDLAAWMAAISSSGLLERNAIIDWLRHQGFQFSQASWIERIHHNGGRLIYADDVAPQPIAKAAPQRLRNDEVPPLRSRPVLRVVPSSTDWAGDSAIQRLLNEAKGLRALANLILREIGRAVPDASFTASNPLIVVSARHPFAALFPSPRKLRFYARFGPEGVHRARPAEAVNKSAPPFPEMLVLDDARHVDEDFQRLIRAAVRL